MKGSSGLKPKVALKPYTAGFPSEQLHCDILGPLTKTTAGNTVILVMICSFTKWIELKALPDQQTPTVVKAIYECYVLRFGVPSRLVTDQGVNFTSELFSAFCELLGIEKIKTISYRPSSTRGGHTCIN